VTFVSTRRGRGTGNLYWRKRQPKRGRKGADESFFNCLEGKGEGFFIRGRIDRQRGGGGKYLSST